MISPIFAIARNTFREAVRNKILYILLFVAVGMIMFSMALAKLSLDQSVRVIKDVGLATISLFGVVIAIFVGINLLYQEIDRRTLYTVLTKPIARWQFVLGKYLGMLLTLVVMTSFMTVVLLGLLASQGVAPDQPLAAAIVLSFMELTIVVAIAVFFSSFSTPFLSGAFTFGIFLLGRLTDDLYEYLPKLELGVLKPVLLWFTYLLPNLYRFTISDHVIYSTPVPWSYVVYTCLYGLVYVAVTLTVASLVFGRRDLP